MANNERFNKNKEFEILTAQKLEPKGYYVLRVDGKNFKKYTKKMNKPFDFGHIQDMKSMTTNLLNEISGSVLGYTQSDEASIIFSDLMSSNSELTFGGKIQKISSVYASMASKFYNDSRLVRLFQSEDSEYIRENLVNSPVFDARVYKVDKDFVLDYLIFRQNDAYRNAVSMAAHNLYSNKQLFKVNTSKKLKMLEEKGFRVEDYPFECWRGTPYFKEYSVEDIEFVDSKGNKSKVYGVNRSKWVKKQLLFFEPETKLKVEKALSFKGASGER